MVVSSFKISTIETSGTSQVFGTADLNKISRFLNGETDIANAEIDSDIAFMQDRFKLRDSSNTNDVTLNADPGQATNVVLSIPLLTADDTIMTLGGTQTLAGKTFNASDNILTTDTPAQGDILRYDATAGGYIRLARGSASQVLQVNVGGTDIAWGAGASGTWNPSGSETLLNKTIGTDTNTIKDSTTNALGDILKGNATKYVRMARGAANTVLQASATDLTYALVGDANIATHTTSKISVLSKSLLNTSIVYKDQNNDLGAFYLDVGGIAAPTSPASGKRRLYVDSVSGAFTLKKSDGTVVSLEASSYSPSNVEVLTNKTMDALSNTFKSIMVAPSIRKVGYYFGTDSNQGSGILADYLTATSTNAVYTPSRDSNVGTYINIATSSTNTDTAAIKTQDAFTTLGFNGSFKVKFRVPTASGCRVDIGFTSDISTDPKNSDWLASKSGVAISYGTGRSNQTSLYISTNNGGAASTFTGPLATLVAGTVYTIEIQLDAANNRIEYSFNGGAMTNVTATIPATATLLGFAMGVQTTTSSARTLDVFWAEIGTDK
jgi:hypothetical protein